MTTSCARTHLFAHLLHVSPGLVYVHREAAGGGAAAIASLVAAGGVVEVVCEHSSDDDEASRPKRRMLSRPTSKTSKMTLKGFGQH